MSFLNPLSLLSPIAGGIFGNPFKKKKKDEPKTLPTIGQTEGIPFNPNAGKSMIGSLR